MSINLPGDIAVDLRDPIAGDSYSWAGLEPAAAKKVIVIHATASEAPNEDGFTMADYHVNHNGWSGIGVHFVVTKDNYQGRPGVPAGAHVQYVGDLLTYRAGVLNNNPGRVHIEISGLFTPGHGVPSEAQLRATRKLIDFLLAPNYILPSMNYPSQIDFHNHQAVPGGQTACPGWQHPQFGEWFGYLQGGAEPSWWHPAPAPQPAPAPAPEPAPEPVVVTPPVDTRPDYEQTWNAHEVSDKVVGVPSADVVDVSTGQVAKSLPGGEPVQKIAGTFTHNGQEYVRTQWSVDHGKWNGILASNLNDVPAQIVNTGVPVDSIQPPAPVIPVLDQPAFPETPQEAPRVTATATQQDYLEALLHLLLSPLRLIGIITNFIKGLKK
jgi:hypothetical protein